MRTALWHQNGLKIFMKLIYTHRIINFFLLLLQIGIQTLSLPLVLVIPALRKRFTEELRDILKVSKNIDHIIQYSSEGELEQVKFPLSLLDNKERLLLVHTSPSVREKTIELSEELQCHYCLNPLMNPLALWLFFTSFRKGLKSVWMVRYDFWPVFFFLGSSKKVETTLFSFTYKGNENAKMTAAKSFFDRVYCATKKDQDKLNSQGVKGETLVREFRIPQILHRIDRVSEHNLSLVKDLNLYIGSQLWENDFFLFDQEDFANFIKENSIHFYIAPHSFKGDDLLKLVSKLEHFSQQYGIPLYQVDSLHKKKELGDYGIIFSTAKGILCEVSTYAKFVYVGGGFGRSIHSILEPFLAAPFVTCGPKTFRSTEFDLATEFDHQQSFRMTKVNTASELMASLAKVVDKQKLEDALRMRQNTNATLKDDYKC
ncbi:MAG: hypothetical protein GY909_13335 [Oligoflexia bacterium]|nr:hypothetical protein [Oligoflexia bacterium]